MPVDDIHAQDSALGALSSFYPWAHLLARQISFNMVVLVLEIV